MTADWNPGTIVHYGRAELKQSDHRPVIAIIDVDVLQVNDERRNQVFLEVMEDLGPPDATIVVHVNTLLILYLVSYVFIIIRT